MRRNIHIFAHLSRGDCNGNRLVVSFGKLPPYCICSGGAINCSGMGLNICSGIAPKGSLSYLDDGVVSGTAGISQYGKKRPLLFEFLSTVDKGSILDCRIIVRRFCIIPAMMLLEFSTPSSLTSSRRNTAKVSRISSSVTLPRRTNMASENISLVHSSNPSARSADRLSLWIRGPVASSRKASSSS